MSPRLSRRKEPSNLNEYGSSTDMAHLALTKTRGGRRKANENANNKASRLRVVFGRPREMLVAEIYLQKSLGGQDVDGQAAVPEGDA